MAEKIILDLCGGTGAWSKPYKENGYDVRIITTPDKDCRSLNFISGVHGILAAPPCTVFASSGARWKRSLDEMDAAMSIVDSCMRIILVSNPTWWCLENPVGTLRRWLGPPRMYFQPYEYGDPYTKKTCLWGNFSVPVKNPVEPVEGGKMWRMGPSPDRAKLRSMTPPGFARAFFKVNP